MKDNYTILKEVSGADGSYYIKINTDIGVFEGKTAPDKIDSQYPSAYHASEIAMAKALRKFAEASVAQLKRERKLLEKMLKQVLDNGDPLEQPCSAFYILKSTLYQKKNELTIWENRVSALTKSIKDRIAARDALVAKYMNKDKVE